jgi:cell division GTPase FtsZ
LGKVRLTISVYVPKVQDIHVYKDYSFDEINCSRRRSFEHLFFMAQVKPDIETFAKIKVVGVGGGGGAAINRMISDKIKGVDFIAVNTDIQALHQNLAPEKIPIGKTITRGLGAGMNPELGSRAAEENINEMVKLVVNSKELLLPISI